MKSLGRTLVPSILVVSLIAVVASTASAQRGDPRSSDRSYKPTCVYVCDTCEGPCISWSSDPSMPSCLQHSTYQCNCRDVCT